jgi:hypothetical protein
MEKATDGTILGLSFSSVRCLGAATERSPRRRGNVFIYLPKAQGKTSHCAATIWQFVARASSGGA